MKVWKHHLAENFLRNGTPTHPNGAAKGGTVFLNFSYMLAYLERDGREWFACELEASPEELIVEFGVPEMATLAVDRLSKTGFKPIKKSEPGCVAPSNGD